MIKTPDMTFSINLTYAWWWMPTAITLLAVLWLMYHEADNPISGFVDLIGALVVSLVAWIVGGFLK